MGLVSSITKLFRKDTQVAECCVDGVCNCSSDGNYLVSDSTAVTTTTSSSACTYSSPSFTSSTDTFVSTVGITTQPVVPVEKPPVTATEDEINIALATAAEADKLEEENYIPTPPPVSSSNKKKSNTKKTISKLNRKSSVKRKKT